MSHFNTFRLTDTYRKRLAQMNRVAIPAGANQGADLSQWCGPVFDQQQEGSCTACSCRDYLLWLQNKYGYSAKTTPPYTDPSVNAIYYYARLLCGDLTVDEGSTEYNAMLAAVEYGVIPTSDDPYGENTLFTPPPLQDVVFKATEARNLLATTASIRASLDAGVPVGIAVQVMSTLFNPQIINGKAIVDWGTAYPEGHGIFVVAYEPTTEFKGGYIYKFQNSWGTDYGIGGYAWFTELYLGGMLGEVVQLDIPQPKPNYQTVIVMTVGKKTYTLNGQQETMDTAPVLDATSSRVFVPVRFIAEALGCKVAWLPDVQHVIITEGAGKPNPTVIVLMIGKTIYSVNGVDKTMDVAPYIDSDNRTMVPIRFVAQALGCTVNWDESAMTVTIEK